ncbi:RPM1 interacting protein 13 isoform X1 [Ziziphus jujuba]|uniref:RPM1 interacting protein 13 isoform X1 n=1 Tax=Ziziphus jujuba TaxID=326968 RepID=A0A6P4ASK3_ZIZJJ|nr:RPM1 interacting protein 13 isoform X1 [Ziziphus jujuba]
MDPGRIVFDISSDEEQDRSEPRSDDYSWISELLGDVDEETDEESDEVVVVGEVNPKPRSKSSRQTLKDVDDDCVVLDGDPDKPVEAAEDSTGGSDELLIVAEKGQIACRDFPHSRHLCASFPFSTTPHEKHCNQCHCYVCDSLAPCLNWGTGISSMDHCHATDKEKRWNIQRSNLKSGKNAAFSTSKISDTSLSITLPQVNPVAPPNIICLSPSPTQQNQVSRPAALRACTSSNFSVPNIISQVRSQQPGFIMNKNRVHPRVISRQIPSVGPRNNNIRRSKFHQMGNFDPQIAPSHNTLFKRSRHFGVSLPMSQSMYSSSNKDGCANPLQYARNPTTMAMSNGTNTFRWEDVSSSTNQSSSQPNLANAVGNTLPSQTQIYSQPVPLSNHSQDFYPNGNQIQNHEQSVCQYGNLSETASQNFGLESNQIASATDMSFPDYNYGWVNNTSLGNQQGHVEQSQVQNTEPVYDTSVVKESNPEFTQSNNLSSVTFDFENWLMDQSAPGSSDGSWPSQLNMLSPEPPVDAGMLLFDFETSWNGLAHV